LLTPVHPHESEECDAAHDTNTETPKLRSRSGQWNWNEHQFYAVATHGQKQVAVGQVGHGAAVGDGAGGRHVALDEKKR